MHTVRVHAVCLNLQANVHAYVCFVYVRVMCLCCVRDYVFLSMLYV